MMHGQKNIKLHVVVCTCARNVNKHEQCTVGTIWVKKRVFNTVLYNCPERCPPQYTTQLSASHAIYANFFNDNTSHDETTDI